MDATKKLIFQVIVYDDDEKLYDGPTEVCLTENKNKALDEAKKEVLQEKPVDGITFLKRIPRNERCYVELYMTPEKYTVITKYCLFTILPNQGLAQKELFQQLKNRETTFDILEEKYTCVQSKRVVAVLECKNF
jgi:hypothetical protein